MNSKLIELKLYSLAALEDGKAETLTGVIKVRHTSGEAGVMCRRDLYGRNMMGSMRLEVRVTTEPELSPQI